jgi:hypothetical protein
MGKPKAKKVQKIKILKCAGFRLAEAKESNGFHLYRDASFNPL